MYRLTDQDGTRRVRTDQGLRAFAEAQARRHGCPVSVAPGDLPGVTVHHDLPAWISVNDELRDERYAALFESRSDLLAFLDACAEGSGEVVYDAGAGTITVREL